jgi:hypothetical protein
MKGKNNFKITSNLTFHFDFKNFEKIVFKCSVMNPDSMHDFLDPEPYPDPN